MMPVLGYEGAADEVRFLVECMACSCKVGIENLQDQYCRRYLQVPLLQQHVFVHHLRAGFTYVYNSDSEYDHKKMIHC